MKKDRQLPIWLRRLAIVKTELKGVRWPTTEAGFQEGLVLMAWGLKALEAQARADTKTSDPEQIQRRVSELLATFAKIDARWIVQSRTERARVFSH